MERESRSRQLSGSLPASPGGVHPLTAVVAAINRGIERVLLATFAKLRMHAFCAHPTALAGGAPSPAQVVCVDVAAFVQASPLGLPTVVVTGGAGVSKEVSSLLLKAAPVALDLDEIEPRTLLGALLRARWGRGGGAPPRFGRVPSRLVSAWLRSPDRVRSVSSAAWAMSVSPRQVREMVRDAGFHRFEACLTVLRAELWQWLVRSGTERSEVEAFLGIRDRSNFRRGCRRIGIHVPWAPPVTEPAVIEGWLSSGV